VVLLGCETWYRLLRKENVLRVFERGVLRRLFGPKRDEVAGGIMRSVMTGYFTIQYLGEEIKGHVACMGKFRNTYKFWSENPKVRDHSEDVGVDGRIILE
jgi:hypothetical protein